MFKFIQKLLDYHKETERLKSKIKDLKFELKHALTITEKYFSLMKVHDRIQLLILRKNLSDR